MDRSVGKFNDDVAKQITSVKHPKKYGAVDTTDDDQLIYAGIRNAHVNVDRGCWKKTPAEKKAAKRARITMKHKFTGSKFAEANTKLAKKLVVNIVNKEPAIEKGSASNKFRTTLCMMVFEEEIHQTLSMVKRMRYTNGELYEIAKVQHNGVTLEKGVDYV